jgi:hypothetical protein
MSDAKPAERRKIDVFAAAGPAPAPAPKPSAPAPAASETGDERERIEEVLSRGKATPAQRTSPETEAVSPSKVPAAAPAPAPEPEPAPAPAPAPAPEPAPKTAPDPAPELAPEPVPAPAQAPPAGTVDDDSLEVEPLTDEPDEQPPRSDGSPASTSSSDSSESAGSSLNGTDEHPILKRPTRFYHGTSLAAALTIQDTGFRVDLSGTNAGAALGPGLYVTTTLEKALNYAKPKPFAGVIFVLRVDLGRCYRITSANDPNRQTWQLDGYDSAWSPAGVIGQREENCIWDTSNRVEITDVLLGNTGEALRGGYEVTHGRVVSMARLWQQKFAFQL